MPDPGVVEEIFEVFGVGQSLHIRLEKATEFNLYKASNVGYIWEYVLEMDERSTEASSVQNGEHFSMVVGPKVAELEVGPKPFDNGIPNGKYVRVGHCTETKSVNGDCSF